MPKRPKIPNDLHEHVERIHEEVTGSSASSFEQALRTVTQLAENEITGSKGIESGWYPGKYIGQVVDRVVNDFQEQHRPNLTQETDPTPESAPPFQQSQWFNNRTPDQMALFKSRLGDGGSLMMPDTEVAALGADEGELLQVAAYRIESE